MKHQFKVLPIRIYAYQNQYSIINLRKIMMGSYDLQIKIAKQNFFLSIFVCSAILAGLAAFALLTTIYPMKTQGKQKDD